MMLNNSNSNNKGWGKRDNFLNELLGNKKDIKHLVDNSWKTWGETTAIHTLTIKLEKLCGKTQLFHRIIPNKLPGLKKEIHNFSTLYPQHREAYEI